MNRRTTGAHGPSGAQDVRGVTPGRDHDLSQLRSVLSSLANEPSQLPDLLRTGREAGRAFRALLRSRDALGLFLGCPYLG